MLASVFIYYSAMQSTRLSAREKSKKKNIKEASLYLIQLK